jgi:hypothetical protein
VVTTNPSLHIVVIGSMWLRSPAGSAGRCNTSLQFICWHLKAQGLSRSLIEAQGDLVEMGLRVDGPVSLLRKVLSVI